MKKNILAVIVTMGAVAGSFMSCSQPPTECQVGLAGNNSFAARYILKGTPSAECKGLVQLGDIIGMEFYHPTSKDGATFDTSQTTLAVQADYLGNANSARGPEPLGPNMKPLHNMWASGSFSAALPDKNGVCSVPTFSTFAQQDFPDVPAVDGGSGDAGMPSTPEMPADTIKYEWKNMQVAVSSAVQGTEFTADLTYTETIAPSTGAPVTCTFEYKAIGIWPAVPCTMVDAGGAPILDKGGNQQPDVTLCSPCQDLDAGRTIASGIGPEIPTSCEAIFTATDPYASANNAERGTQFYCVLKGATAATTLPVLGTAPTCGSVIE